MKIYLSFLEHDIHVYYIYLYIYIYIFLVKNFYPIMYIMYHNYCLFTDLEASNLQADGDSSETGSTEQRESG